MKTMTDWENKFYSQIDNNLMSQKGNLPLLKHSLKKWVGLRDCNLKEYNLKLNLINRRIECDSEGVCLWIDSDTCALCRRYFGVDYFGEEIETDCLNCPLYRNGKACDDDGEPYRVWTETGNPEPMIEALKKAIHVHFFLIRLEK